MATKKIERAGVGGRWLKRHQAIGWLNITEKTWEAFFAGKVCEYLDGCYDKIELDRRMEELVQVSAEVGLRQYNKRH